VKRLEGLKILGVIAAGLLLILLYAFGAVYVMDLVLVPIEEGRAPACWVEPEQSDGLDFGEVIWSSGRPVFCGVARNGLGVQRICIPMRPGVGIECRVGRVKK
jgi:hypothetical protein